MNTWNIEFNIQAIRCEEKNDCKRKIVKNETICNIEVTDSDLNRGCSKFAQVFRIALCRLFYGILSA